MVRRFSDNFTEKYKNSRRKSSVAQLALSASASFSSLFSLHFDEHPEICDTLCALEDVNPFRVKVSKSDIDFRQAFLNLIFEFQQPTWRYWGEEKVPGAIYTVYLKKVRYHSPSKSIHSVRTRFNYQLIPPLA